MKTYTILPLALLALVASQPLLHRAPCELTESDRTRVESEVTEFLASYLEILEGDDTEVVRELYVDDGRFAWFTDGEKRYTSGDEILASLASMRGMKFETDSSEVEVVPLTPHLAHARSAFDTKIVRGDAVVYEFSGVITWLLEASKDGEWKVLSGHTSTPKEH